MITVAFVGRDELDQTALIYQSLLETRNAQVVWFHPDEVLRDDSWLDAVDAVIDVVPFMGDEVTEFYELVERAGVPTLNRAQAATMACNKWLSYCRVASAGLAVPRSTIVANELTLLSEANRLGYPLVLKHPFGMQGTEVRLAHNHDELVEAARELHLAQIPLMLQHYVECSASDRRIVVVDEEVVDCHERVAMDDSFRSNVSLGGRATRVSVEDDERSIAIQVARVLGMTVAGMDIARVTEVLPGRDYLPLGSAFWIEANKCPGFRDGDYSPPIIVDSLLSRVTAQLEAR